MVSFVTLFNWAKCNTNFGQDCNLPALQSCILLLPGGRPVIDERLSPVAPPLEHKHDHPVHSIIYIALLHKSMWSMHVLL